MREERGTLVGNQIVDEPLDLWGSIVGDVRVVDGGKLYVRGAIYGRLRVEDGGRVHIFGQVTGDLHVYKGAKVIHSGIVGGDAVNHGGRLYIDSFGRVLGKLRRRSGETNVDSRAQVNE